MVKAIVIVNSWGYFISQFADVTQPFSVCVLYLCIQLITSIFSISVERIIKCMSRYLSLLRSTLRFMIIFVSGGVMQRHQYKVCFNSKLLPLNYFQTNFFLEYVLVYSYVYVICILLWFKRTPYNHCTFWIFVSFLELWDKTSMQVCQNWVNTNTQRNAGYGMVDNNY